METPKLVSLALRLRSVLLPSKQQPKSSSLLSRLPPLHLNFDQKGPLNLPLLLLPSLNLLINLSKASHPNCHRPRSMKRNRLKANLALLRKTRPHQPLLLLEQHLKLRVKPRLRLLLRQLHLLDLSATPRKFRSTRAGLALSSSAKLLSNPITLMFMI